MSNRPTYEELKKKLAEAEKLIAGIGGREVDDIIHERDAALLGVRELEEAYIESEQNFRNALDISPLGIRIVTEDGELLYANQAMLNICWLGSIEELKAIPREQLYTPESYAEHRERVKERNRGELLTGDYEISIRCPNGEVRNLQVFRREIAWGGESNFMSMYQDITERKQAEEALRESEGFSNSLLVNSPNPIIVLNPDTSIRYINPALEQLTGFSLEEVIGRKAPYPWWTDGTLGKMNEQLKIALSEGVKQLDEIFQKKSGERFWVEINNTRVIENGKLKYLVGNWLDVTERKKLENIVEKDRKEYELIIDSSPINIFYKDEKGKFVHVNKAQSKALNMPEKDFLGKTVFDLYSTDIAQSMTYDDNEVFQSGHPKLNIVEQYESASGLRWVQTDKIPIIDENGIAVGLIGFAQDITERKRAEEALRESEVEKDAILSSMTELVAYQDLEHRILWANRAASESIGLAYEQMVGRHCYEIWQQRSEPCAGCPIISTRETGQPQETEMTTNDGRIWSIRGYPIRDANGDITGVVELTQDITERKRAEEAVLKHKDLLDETGKMAKVGGWEFDTDTLEQTWTEEVYRIHEVDMDFQPTVEKGISFYAPEAVPVMSEAVRRAIDFGEPYDLELPFITAKGNHRWVHAIGKAYQEDGKTVKVGGTFQDITERKKAEERINNLNRALRSIRNVNQLITREKDRDRLIRGICNALVESHSFNSAWIALLDDSRRLLTFAEKSRSGDLSPLLELLKRREYPPCVQKALSKEKVVVIRNPQSTCLECPLHSAPADSCGLAIRLEYEESTYGILCASAPKEMLSDEDEMTLFDEVATDIAFALHDISLEEEYKLTEEERLRGAKLESISTLAGGIAHDFNNLLTGIMGNIGLAKSYADLPQNASKTLDEAEKAAIRARDLTQQLLTFARGGKPVKRIINIGTLCKEAATFALRGSAVKLELSLPDDLWPVEADEGQLNQVIHNIVINADEAMPSGGVLKITLANSVLKKMSALPLPKGNYVHIEMRDTGIGISQEHYQRIFEPYFTTKKKGSGLGLSTAYSIIKNHGGYITAEPAQDSGTIFRIFLPATRKPARVKKELKRKHTIQTGGRILVMDDERIIRSMLKNMLSLAGYKAVLTRNGEEALEKYSRAMEAGEPFNAVIMDLTIPGGMGGKEAIIKLRQIDPGVKAIVSSGYATDPIMSEYKKYGFSAVIAKPYSIKQLEETLRSLLKRNK